MLYYNIRKYERGVVMTRHEAREQAFAVIFEKSFNESATFQEIIDAAEECGLVKVNGFAGALLKSVEDNIEKVDEVILENLVGWTLQRLPKVSLAVLRLAVAEIMFNEDVPANVSVNEAVEIAKTYGTVEDASYINGVLSSVVKKLNK
ncbi:MAG: transcription antitermination factor NusB [Clostridia bacterium]|nr:transcription antitermination factor NusB [Clostridia bacterium]